MELSAGAEDGVPAPGKLLYELLRINCANISFREFIAITSEPAFRGLFCGRSLTALPARLRRASAFPNEDHNSTSRDPPTTSKRFVARSGLKNCFLPLLCIEPWAVCFRPKEEKFWVKTGQRTTNAFIFKVQAPEPFGHQSMFLW